MSKLETAVRSKADRNAFKYFTGKFWWHAVSRADYSDERSAIPRGRRCDYRGVDCLSQLRTISRVPRFGWVTLLFRSQAL